VAIICAHGVSAANEYENALLKEDAKGFIIAPHLGSVRTDAEGHLLRFQFSDLLISFI
jgi:catalase